MADLDLSQFQSASPADVFTQTYSPVAQKIADAINAPVTGVLGQLALETNYGKSIIPGTNNLGNIKTSGGGTAPGVSATDNQLGTNSNYKQYNSVDDFANDYINLIKNNYPQAVGTQTPQAFAQALKKGGYAEDPNYVSKVTNVATKVAGLLTGSTNANAADNPQNQSINLSNFTPVSSSSQNTQDTSSQNINLANYQPAQQTSGVSDFFEGLKHGVIDAGLGLGSLASRVVNAVGDPTQSEGITPDLQAQQDYQNQVKQAAQSSQNTIQNTANSNTQNFINATNGGTSTPAKVGDFIGSVAPYFLIPEVGVAGEGGSLLARAGLRALNGAANGGIQFGLNQAANASLNNQPITPALATGAAEGAALGGLLGPVAGLVSEFGTKLQNNAANKAVNKTLSQSYSPTEITAGKTIANQVAKSGDDVNQVGQQLVDNGTSQIPGVNPTAAEATDNQAIQQIQSGLQNVGDATQPLNAQQAANRRAIRSDLDNQAGNPVNTQSQNASDLANQEQTFANTASQTPTVGEGTPLNDFLNTNEGQTALQNANNLAQQGGDNSIQNLINQNQMTNLPPLNETAANQLNSFSNLGASATDTTGQFLADPTVQSQLSTMNIGKLNNLIDTITKGKTSGDDLASQISDAKLQQLTQLRDDLVQASKPNATGLTGQQADYLRQANPNNQAVQASLQAQNPAYTQAFQQAANLQNKINAGTSFRNIINDAGTQHYLSDEIQALKSITSGNIFSQVQKDAAQRAIDALQGRINGKNVAMTPKELQSILTQSNQSIGTRLSSWAIEGALGKLGGVIGHHVVPGLGGEIGGYLGGKAGEAISSKLFNIPGKAAAQTNAQIEAVNNLLANPSKLGEFLKDLSSAQAAQQPVKQSGLLNNVTNKAQTGLLGAVNYNQH